MKKKNHPPTAITITITCVCVFLLLPTASAQSQPDDEDGISEPDIVDFNSYSPSIAIILVIMVAAFFLLGFYSIYIRHCSNSSTTSVHHRRRNIRPRAVPVSPLGLDKSVILTFPILEYSEVKTHKIGKEALECAICLCEFEDAETLRLIPKCDHVFHPDCIDKWLSSHTTCPVCRADLVPRPGDSVPDLSLPQDININNDIEAPNDAVSVPAAPEQQNADQLSSGESKSGRVKRARWLTRSHSTGHSLVRPGLNTERFTLRLPLEFRKGIINRQLQRASSQIVLPRENSSGHQVQEEEGGSRWTMISRLMGLSFKTDRWVFSTTPPFLVKVFSTNASAEGTSSSSSAVS